MAEMEEQLNSMSKKIGIGAIRRHVFLCVGDKCCTDEVGLAAWEKLKQKLKDVGLSSGDAVCQRTRAGCLRICCHGPVMVVYPEGVWYHGMTVDKIDRLVDEHLIAGKPIDEWIFARNPLT